MEAEEPETGAVFDWLNVVTYVNKWDVEAIQ